MEGADYLLVTAVLLIFICFVVIAESERREASRKRRLDFLMRGSRRSPSVIMQGANWLKAQMARPEFLAGVITGLLVIVAAILFSLSVITALVLFIAACAAAWYLVRGIRLRKMRALFAERFPDAIENLTRAVQAGVPMEKALIAIGENYEGEIGRRFTLLIRQLELGVSFRTATKNFAESLNMPDVEFFCSVLALNRESGSRLTPMLISLSRTLRERRTVARKLKVMTSETRSAAKVLSLLPCLVLAMQFFMNPGNFKFLFYDPTGRFILGCCIALMVTGIIIINRMSKLGGN